LIVGGLAATGLTLSRGPRRLFSGLSFTLQSGEALVLRGANGSGKTTLLRVLAGLTVADAGELRWNDQRWTALCASQRAASLYLGHTNALKDELSAAENLAESLAFDGVEVAVQLQHQSLDDMGLAERHHLPARRLSQGQKRRVGLARLALAKKSLWLLDEPTNALDSEGVALFSGVVAAHLKQGGMACIASHLPLTIAAPVHELVLGGVSA
jgi:heme exporter protein A